MRIIKSLARNFLVVAIILLFCNNVFAQWSATGGLSSTPLTTEGNVGIGIPNPQEKLELRGRIKIVDPNGAGNKLWFHYIFVLSH